MARRNSVPVGTIHFSAQNARGPAGQQKYWAISILKVYVYSLDFNYDKSGYITHC